MNKHSNLKRFFNLIVFISVFCYTTINNIIKEGLSFLTITLFLLAFVAIFYFLRLFILIEKELDKKEKEK